jgi:hypothetical protein
VIVHRDIETNHCRSCISTITNECTIAPAGRAFSGSNYTHALPYILYKCFNLSLAVGCKVRVALRLTAFGVRELGFDRSVNLKDIFKACDCLLALREFNQILKFLTLSCRE